MATANMRLTTPVTAMFGIQHPIILAGMNVAAGPELAAAVTNAGGLGVIGGVGYTPAMLQRQIDELKSFLNNKDAPFGVDLLLPKVGEGARPTNTDYTGGKLPELIDIIIAAKAKLFVSAVGIPPTWAVEKLHKAGIVVANMIGAPKHVAKALDAGADLLIAQGGEGGGHTGDVATSILIPKVVDLCRGRTSPLTGKPVYVVAAGGIFDGRGLAMALALGAQAAWVGTRFVCAKEAGAPKRHQDAIVAAGYHDTIRTTIYTGRPMRVLKTPFVADWEENKPDEIKRLTSKGIVPIKHMADELSKSNKMPSFEEQMQIMPLLMGACAGAIENVLPAKEIMDMMIAEACETMLRNAGLVQRNVSKL